MRHRRPVARYSVAVMADTAGHGGQQQQPAARAGGMSHVAQHFSELLRVRVPVSLAQLATSLLKLCLELGLDLGASRFELVVALLQFVQRLEALFCQPLEIDGVAGHHPQGPFASIVSHRPARSI